MAAAGVLRPKQANSQLTLVYQPAGQQPPPHPDLTLTLNRHIYSRYYSNMGLRGGGKLKTQNPKKSDKKKFNPGDKKF